MLNSIRVTNFHSIGETQALSLEVTKKDILDNSTLPTNVDKGLNLVSCIVGHNASGKTNILKALTFLNWFVTNSYEANLDEIPLDKHKLWLDKPTKFELNYIDRGVNYFYSLELDTHTVISEYFGKKIARGFTRIFEYTRVGDEWKFKSPELEINSVDLKRFKERKRVSVLSSLVQLGYIKAVDFFENFYSNVNRSGMLGNHNFDELFDLSGHLNEDRDLLSRLSGFIKEVDLGVDGFGFREVVLKSKSEEDSNKYQILEAIHKSTKGEFKLNLFEESNGTQQSISLLTKLLPILNSGGLVIVDEIEAGLHPYVVRKIVGLFETKETNPQNAQLIFSTHQHMLLNDRTKTQIFLVEKDVDSFESEIYRLDDVEDVRNDENYFQKYITGVYGATPKIYFF